MLALPALLLGQNGDSTSASPPPNLDRSIIDVAALVRRGAARTLSDVLISQVPGLLVVPGSGLNGGGARIRFAGVRSLIADVSPLILLDGVRIDAREDDSQLLSGGPGPSRLDDIPIEDVQSVEVLRGPASTARYGPGAAAGVILIRSKEGQSGAVRFTGFVQAALRERPSEWPTNYGGVDLDNPNTSLQRGGCSLTAQASGACIQDFVQSFNPLVERNPFASAPHRQIGLSATAGPKWGAFRVSGSLDGDAAAYAVPAVRWADDNRNWKVRVSGTVHPIPNLDLAASVGRISRTLRLPMYFPVLGALIGPSDSTGFTWAPLFQNSGTQDADRTQVGIKVNVRPRAWLAIQAALGQDDVEQHELVGQPSEFRAIGRRSGATRTLAFSAAASNIAWRGMRLTTTIGIEKLTQDDDARLGGIYPDTTACGPGSFPCSFISQRITRRVNTLGVYGVQQIGMGGRLLVTGTLRRDGFQDFRTWSATHPSLAVDWIARPEQRGVVGRLVFRAAYGTADQPLPDLPLILYPVFPPPPAPLKPERARDLELSAEASGLGGRWRAHASVYDLRSRVIDFSVVPTSTGFTPVYVNGAVISNRGVAAAVWANLFDRPELGWDVRLSFWGNRNRLVTRAGPPVLYGDGANGQGEFAGYPANGYWGRPITFSDSDGDGIISAAEVAVGAAPAWAGTPYPTQGAALTSSWRVARRWRVSTTLDYRAGQTLFNRTASLRCMTARCLARNDPATPLANQATAVAAGALPPEYFEDADYLKLREVALTFDVPERAAAAIGARAATVMIGGRDLVTWSNYSGADPEAGSYGTHTVGTPMVVRDFGTVPLRRSWAMRVRVTY